MLFDAYMSRIQDVARMGNLRADTVTRDRPYRSPVTHGLRPLRCASRTARHRSEPLLGLCKPASHCVSELGLPLV